MSRSNPNEHNNPNPSTRRFEWNGETGKIRYYDKDIKANVDVGDSFTFLLLDQLGRVGGWHDATDSAIYSNEVKDTRQETLIVRASKGGTLAEGIYRDIKDRVNTFGGHFVANCYIAFKNGGGNLSIGTLQIKGAALGAWMEFCKAHKADIYEKAIKIQGYTEGKKGKVMFRVPEFYVMVPSADTAAAALALDKELQKYFASYFKQPKREQIESAPQEPLPEEPPHPAMANELPDDPPF